MHRAVHPARLEVKHLPELTHPCLWGDLGGRQSPPSSLRCPDHDLPIPRWGKKASAAWPALSPFSLLSVLAQFPKERRLPPACHAATILCSPALTLLPGDLCAGGPISPEPCLLGGEFCPQFACPLDQMGTNVPCGLRRRNQNNKWLDSWSGWDHQPTPCPQAEALPGACSGHGVLA